jgi:hypothetical protein
MCNFYCFTTAVILTRTRLTIPVYVHRLSCFLVKVSSTYDFYPTTSTDLFLRNVQNLSGAYPASYSKCTRGHFPARKAVGALRWLLTSKLVTSLRTGGAIHLLLPLCLHDTYRENFTFDVRMWLAHTNCAGIAVNRLMKTLIMTYDVRTHLAILT